MATSFSEKIIGKYKLIEKVGLGAMADVFKAQNPDLDRVVAIKLLDNRKVENTGALRLFRQEARNVAALNHPNIVQVFDFDVFQGKPYMVMEYIDGGSLKDHLRSLRNHGQVISLKEAVRIMKGVAEALSYAHERGMVHRDIKPGNILIARDGRVVLTDFGLARVMMDSHDAIEGRIIGTPAYLSPEQAEGKPGDQRSDIYSLGVILYEMFTGRYPFRGDTPLEIIQKHIHAPLLPPSRLNPKMPMQIEPVIMRAMAKKPADRFPSAEDFLEALSDINLENGIARAPATSRPDLEQLSRPSLAFKLHESNEILTLPEQDRYLLGRKDVTFDPDVDLAPYDGYKKGVSRRHAEVFFEEGSQFILRDLQSTNGTWLNGKILESGSQTVLNNGDLITLGELVIQTLIQE